MMEVLPVCTLRCWDETALTLPLSHSAMLIAFEHCVDRRSIFDCY